MIVSIIIGRKGSQGFPGKNTFKVFGKPLCSYPLEAARNTGMIDEFYFSTDCPELRKFAQNKGSFKKV